MILKRGEMYDDANYAPRRDTSSASQQQLEEEARVFEEYARVQNAADAEHEAAR